MRNLAWLAVVLLALGVATPAARADDSSAISTFALVIGSNAGGPGQAELRYAEDDARKVALVLTELGGYAPDTVDVVVHPTPQLVRDKLARLATRVQAEIANGRQARVFFYYSGHARANAIDLGNDELPLPELRTRLFAVPATLTVVVLDACQSGAFSRVKGAEPAADFSFSSKQHLDATGVAVLASSSGSELSQESERLHSSYFTHHLLVGLRGAGDANGDGQVSIDEAYRYAYHQTLLATAETAVGGQHVTFEADLKGHGEVPLSFPTRATATIVLPGPLEGHAMVENRRAKAVVAETYKARGAAVRIAVAPGDYDVLVRGRDRVARCSVIATGDGVATVDLAHCTSERIDVGATKGGAVLATWAPQTRIEVTALVGGERDDAYTRTLENFEYRKPDFLAVSTGLSVVGLRRVAEYLWVGGGLATASSPEWTRATDVSPLRFSFSTTTALAIGHLETPITQGGHIGVFARAGLGLGLGRTAFVDVNHVETTDTFVGPAATVGLGIRFSSIILDGAALQLGYQYDYARVIDNLVGDTHGSGGHRAVAGLSYSF